MRVGTVSAVCALLSFTFAPRPAAAQSPPAVPRAPQVPLEKAHGPDKPFQLLTDTEEVRKQLPTDSTNKPADARQTPKIFVWPQDGDIGSALRPPGESPNCAHIIVFQAPEMDSPILKEVPKHFGGNMPEVEALPPCSRDFRLAMRAQFPGFVFPRRGPFFRRPPGQFPSAEPTSDRRPNEAPAAKP